MSERTWEISDIDGRGKRTVTLAQYRAELDARKVYTARIADAVRRGDLAACAEAQAEMRRTIISIQTNKISAARRSTTGRCRYKCAAIGTRLGTIPTRL